MRLFLLSVVIIVEVALSPLFSQSTGKLNSKHFVYQYISVQEGLSNQRIYSVLEDHRGFIWISTRTGIDCFNGRKVKNYSLYPQNLITDETGRMAYLLKDDEDILWAYTDAGKIFRYEPDQDTFVLTIDVSLLFSQEISLNCMWFDDSGKLWLGMTEGLFYYSADTGIRNVLSAKNVNSLLFSFSTKVLYIATEQGVYELDPYKEDTLKQLLPAVNVKSVFYDSKTQYLWLGTFNEGVILVDINTGLIKEECTLKEMPHVPYRTIVPYDEDVLLLGADGKGVYVVTRDGAEAWLLFTADFEGGGQLKGNGVYTIYKDCTSNLWIGGYAGGITIANPRRNFFEQINHVDKNEQSLIDDHVNAIVEDDDGDLWYATNQGISLYLKEKRMWRHFGHGKIFLTMCKDEMGQIWAGGYGTGVYCINKHTGIKQHLTKAGGILTTDYVYSIVKDQDDELWIGGMFGNLVRYSPAKADKPAVYETYNVSFINSISVVSKDTVALATIKGFYLLNKRSGYFRGYFMSPSDLGIQSNSFIQCLYFEKPNLVWFGTDGGGLNRMNLETGDVVNLSESDGLPSNYIYGIVPDDEGRIWVSTDKGLAYLVSTQPEVMRMELLDGISNDFSLRSYTKLQNGDLIWGSADGVIRFTPKEMDVHSYKAPLHFISFEVPQCSQERNGMISGMLNRGETINLRYDENTFLISFISVSYQYQKDIQYRYILENFDQEWSELVEEPDARYTNIPPGNYVFRVQSVSKNGKFQLDDQEIHIYIAPPYWNTLAAWIVYFVVCVGISYFVWRFFINKMEKKHFQEKIQFFINTAHDIRTPVALIMAPLCDLSRNANWSEKEKKYLQIARNNTEKLSKMIEQLLEFQRIEGTYLKLNVGEYDLKQYLKDKVAYFLPMCENKRITMHLQLPDSAVLLWLDKDKTDKIFDNLLSNAIKYTGINGKIWITVVQTDKKVMVEIKDNGIGIPLKAQKHVFTNFYRAENAVNSRETGSGIGLLLVRRLMKRYKGEVSFTSKENEGTKFTLTFRKGNRHLKPYSTLSPSRSSESLYEYKNFQVNHELCSDQSGLSLATTENGESGRKRILIIEDNDDLRFYLKETFIPIYDVIAMPDGESAMGYLHENLVDLIISDIMMPGIQGDELCKQLKSKLRTSHIPIILLTAKAEKEFVIGGLEGGADDYVTKPFDVEVLVAKVKAILQNRSMLHQYFQSFFKDDVCSGQDVNDLPSSPCLSTLDKDFLQHCTQYILENLSDEHFTINQLCQELAMSRTLFYEKLKALTGQAPNDFIKSIRMKEAVKLLKEKKSVSEVAMKVGFADTKYFSTVFKKCFGVSPSKYQSGF